jgi:hypothetical protein
MRELANYKYIKVIRDRRTAMEMKGRSEPATGRRGGQQKVKGEEHSRRRIAEAKTVRRERR